MCLGCDFYKVEQEGMAGKVVNCWFCIILEVIKVIEVNNNSVIHTEISMVTTKITQECVIQNPTMKKM